MSWTDSRIAQLKQLWDRGLTASQIAEELGGVSRNAVIGKAHRLGLQARPSPVKGHDEAYTLMSRSANDVADVDPPISDSAPIKSTIEVDEMPEVEEVVRPTVREPIGAPVHPPYTPPASAPTGQQLRSIGPGGFLRQGPGDQLPPASPAPPRRLVPAKPNADMADKTSLLDLNERICKWPLGHPGEPDFHFCGNAVNPGFPYCVSHCSHAYQAQMPRRDRRAPPPMQFSGTRPR